MKDRVLNGVASAMVWLVDNGPLSRLSPQRAYYVLISIPLIPLLVWFAVVAWCEIGWWTIPAMLAQIAWAAWVWRRRHAREWEGRLWDAAEAVVAQDDDADIVTTRIMLDVRMKYPARDFNAAMAFLDEHDDDMLTRSEFYALIETAPPRARSVLRALYKPTEETP